MKRYVAHALIFISCLFSSVLLAQQALTIPAEYLAEQHGISTIALCNSEGKECLIPKESSHVLECVSTATSCNINKIDCGPIASSTLETIAQALWSFYYAKSLSTFDILQHVAQDAYLPWLSPQELAHLKAASKDLNFEVLTHLAAIPMVSVLIKKEGEKGIRFVLPVSQAQLSTRIKTLLTEPSFTENKEVILTDVSAHDMHKIAEIMWAIHEHPEAKDGTLLDALLVDVPLSSSSATQVNAGLNLLKASLQLEFPVGMTYAAQVIIINTPQEKISTFLDHLGSSPLVKATFTDQMLLLKKWNRGEIAKEEKIGLTLREKWEAHKQELLASRIHGTRFDFSDIHLVSTDGLHHIPNLHRATELLFSENKLSEFDTSRLAKCNNLRMLDLSFNQLTDLNVLPLQAMPSLQSLKLRGNNFSEEAKQKITKSLAEKKVTVIF